MRLCIALPGLHRVDRGAEVALERVADLLARRGDCDVVVFGSGPARAERAYRYVSVPCIARERFEGWPRGPIFRDECAYEELSFAWNFKKHFEPCEFDLTLTCGYPFLNWVLRSGRRQGRPKHVFVTQNGDWPAYSRKSEYRFFGCDGLICVNPLHQERNRTRWRCALISNGVDLERFKPAPGQRSRFGLPEGVPVVLMVSALIASKNVAVGIRSVAKLPDAFLVVAGDGPLRDQTDRLASQLLPDRYRRLSCTREEMEALYPCADVFLHLSRDESCGVANLEALAAGIPIVAQDSPVARWMLEDLARFVEIEAEAEIVAALHSALHDTSLDRRVAQRELARRRFSWSTIATQYSEFLNDVLDAPRPAASGKLTLPHPATRKELA